MILLILAMLLGHTALSQTEGIELLKKSEILSSEIKTLDITTESEFKAFIKSRGEVLLQQFEAQYDPYQGYDSIPEKCKKINLMKPASESNKDHLLILYSLYSSKDKVIGDCSSESSLMKVQYLMLFCKKNPQKGFVGKFFYSNEKDWILTPLAKCKR